MTDVTDQQEVSEEEAPHPADPALGPPATPVPAPPTVVVHRWVQAVLLPISLLAGYALLRAAAPVIGLFVVAGVIAMVLNPLVTFVHRRRVPRGLAVAVVYLGFIFGMVGVGVALANPISDQAQKFGDDAPSIADSANKNLSDLQDYFDRKGVNIEVKKQGEDGLETLRDKVVGGTSDIVSAGTSIAEHAITASLGFILVVVLSIYMLIYAPAIGRTVRSVMPASNGTPEDDFPARVQKAVGGYVRGQLLFSFAMGTGAAIALYIYGLLGIFPQGRTYAIAFGIFFGLMELVPFVGPFLGALPPVLVALFTDPITAIWVALLFLALQQIEGHIVAPQIFGHALRINPLLVIFSLLVGGELYGFVGALIALPIAAIVRETVDYLRERVVLQPWSE